LLTVCFAILFVLAYLFLFYNLIILAYVKPTKSKDCGMLWEKGNIITNTKNPYLSVISGSWRSCTRSVESYS